MNTQPIMQWMPHATVAAIVEDQGKFLLVEEETDRGNRYNQPAGHLEDKESLLQVADSRLSVHKVLLNKISMR